MQGMTVERAARICRGEIIGEGDKNRELRYAVIDSRAVSPGDIFAAYKGDRVDGHDYIPRAFDNGAACCLAERVPEGERRQMILVADVQRALEQICAAYRTALTLPVIGITGSVGKTSAKEMIASVLSQRLCVLKTDKNLNNQIGVPMTLSRIEPQHQAAVVEMGISRVGDMRELGEMVRPDIAVFTVIGHAHLEFLRDLEGVMREKTEMLDYMAPGAPAVINGDDKMLAKLHCTQRLVRFGLGESCDVRAENICSESPSATNCTIVCAKRRIDVTIPAFGQHMVYAALEGAAVGFELGLSDSEIAAGIAAYETVGRRAAVTDTGYITLIDDSYNANPESVKNGIDSLMKSSGRHVCILGDMLELGENGPELHYSVGRYAAESGVDVVAASGKLGGLIAEGAGDAGLRFEDRAALTAALGTIVRKGDSILVKASRGARYDEISEALKTLRD